MPLTVPRRPNHCNSFSFLFVSSLVFVFNCWCVKKWFDGQCHLYGYERHLVSSKRVKSEGLYTSFELTKWLSYPYKWHMPSNHSLYLQPFIKLLSKIFWKLLDYFLRSYPHGRSVLWFNGSRIPTYLWRQRCVEFTEPAIFVVYSNSKASFFYIGLICTSITIQAISSALCHRL